MRDGREMVSSVIFSQIKTHQRFGGVVPELASREHLDKIVPVIEEAFQRASVTQGEVDGIAVTITIRNTIRVAVGLSGNEIGVADSGAREYDRRGGILDADSVTARIVWIGNGSRAERHGAA